MTDKEYKYSGATPVTMGAASKIPSTETLSLYIG